MKNLLFYFAAGGWLISLLVHLLSVADVDLLAHFPFVMALHIGVFVVGIPVFFYTRSKANAGNTRRNPIALLRTLFGEQPIWMKGLAAAGFFYAILNFSLFMASQPGVPDIRDGQYILHNHGQLIKTLTEQEYHHYQANVVRGFSGHWIAFYGIIATLAYPLRRREPSTPPPDSATRS
jgi:hypothetical protein